MDSAMSISATKGRDPSGAWMNGGDRNCREFEHEPAVAEVYQV